MKYITFIVCHHDTSYDIVILVIITFAETVVWKNFTHKGGSCFARISTNTIVPKACPNGRHNLIHSTFFFKTWNL